MIRKSTNKKVVSRVPCYASLVTHSTPSGFTLIETLIGALVFAMIAVAIYESYAKTFELAYNAKVKIIAAALANEQFEIMRNLPYSDVGLTTAGGGSHGKIVQNQTFTRSGISFSVTTNIRGEDDSFDGIVFRTPQQIADGVPKDPYNAFDYKIMQLTIDCTSCKNFQPLTMVAQIGPKNGETSSNNGAIIVRVFDASGQPVPDATVRVYDDQAVPPIDFSDTTNNEGIYYLFDTPPSTGLDYEIFVSKTGYTSDKTYEPGDPVNNNPDIPHTNIRVFQNEMGEAAFSIDKVSTINVSSVFDNCAAAGNADFTIEGTKSIGIDTLKYPLHNFTTDSGGAKVLTDMEWDDYKMALNDAAYDFAGSIPLFPFALSPNTAQNIQIITAPSTPRSLLVTVMENGSNPPTPITGASVTLSKTSAGYEETKTTGRGTLKQSDWSGGEGQNNFTAADKYFSSTGINDSQQGEIKLIKILDNYTTSGELISSTFDTGPASNFYQISWLPQTQPPETGTDSVKFQVASNNDNATWNFTGPDGTASTYYTLADNNIHSSNNGNRYFRYKAFLHTDTPGNFPTEPGFSPTLAEVAFTFTAQCVPPGQVLFSGRDNGSHKLTVSKTGYQSVEDVSVSMNDPWQQQVVSLTPQ